MISARGTAVAAICAVLGLLLASLLLAFEFLARPWIVVGPSMVPALQPGDRVLVDVWTYRYRLPRPGEIVLFRTGPGTSAVVKRVSRIVPAAAGRGATLWMLGDNPRDSLDSRQLGPVPSDRIIGRVALRIGSIAVHEYP